MISRSPTDVQPVFDAIVARAVRICEAEFGAVARFDEGLLRLVALYSLPSEEAAAFHSLFPRPFARNFAMGRAFVDAQPVQFEDVLDHGIAPVELVPQDVTRVFLNLFGNGFYAANSAAPKPPTGTSSRASK